MRRSSGRRRARRVHAVPLGEIESVGLRVLAGRPIRWRHRRAGVVVIASDADAGAGVAAVWLVRGPGSTRAVDESCLFERVGGSWRYLGGGAAIGVEVQLEGRPSASLAGAASMITSMSGAAVRSHGDLEPQGGEWNPASADWVACERFRVATEVQQLQVGTRRITVPEHGYAIVAWKAPAASDLHPRPAIAAVGGDGSRLAEIGPGDHLDSATWAAVEAAIDGE